MLRNNTKRKICFIQTTAATFKNLAESGLLNRQRKLFQQYIDDFLVEVYSSDKEDYSHELGIVHRKPPFHVKLVYFNHLIYYIWLILRSPFIKGAIVVSGVSLPILPIIKFFSNQKIIIYFKYNWAIGVKKDYGGLKGFTSELVQWLSIKSADLVICTAEWLKDIVRNQYNQEAIVNPNSVDDKVFYPSTEKTETIIYAGRLHWSKGIDTLIEAHALLVKELPDVKLMICGQGEDENRLKEKTYSSGTNNIEFLGLVDQVHLGRLIAKAKVFVLPTLTMEGHPKALIEAMSCGTACVVTDVPGNNNIVEHEKTGLLFPSGNSNALFESLKKIITNEKLRKTIEKDALDYARKQFGFHEVLSKELKIIQKLLE